MSDDQLAQLLSIFEDVPVNALKNHLLKHKTVEKTIDFLLNQKVEKNAFDVLSSKDEHMQRIKVFSKDISRFLPAVLIEKFLDDDLANCLLLDMMEESKEWHVRNFSLFGRNVQSPHTTAFYIDESRRNFGSEVPDSEQSYYTGIPGYKSKSRSFLPRMINARNAVEECVQKELGLRQKHELELKELWESNIVVANRYKNNEQGVGSHADRLTFLGPMPTIASLTLGAERIFRVKKIINDGVGPSTFDISLPHNSLLIMLPPFQEEYKHEIPKCKVSGIRSHRLSGMERINLTYRVARPEYCKNIVICKCGNPCDLRPVSKKEKNKGKYFYMCSSSGSASLNKPMGYTCGHFEWLLESDNAKKENQYIKFSANDCNF